MQCIYCKYPKTSVVYTDKPENRHVTLRRRECIKCGKRFSTQEMIRSPYEFKTNPPSHVLAPA